MLDFTELPADGINFEQLIREILLRSEFEVHWTGTGPDGRSRLEKLAKSTGRSRSFLAAEAITAYLDTNEWQISGITVALSSLDRGKGIVHDRVKRWVGSWETIKRASHSSEWMRTESRRSGLHRSVRTRIEFESLRLTS
jgi:predicted transcriptional regulator